MTAAAATTAMPASGYGRRALADIAGLLRATTRLRLRCLLLGHEDGFAREPDRLRLRCARCGRATAGWAIGPGTSRPPLVAQRASAPRGASPRAGGVTGSQVAQPGRWLTLWRKRSEARERQRHRMVAAARAAAPRADAS
jgi:hypothetical protein